jgi:Domain of unknown function (DUF4365)
MNIRYPIRHDNHKLAELSERYFGSLLPPNWAAERQYNDYGVDLRVEIFNRGLATGRELLVQLKASSKPSIGETERIRLRTATYNYLWGKLQVVMLVKYIRSENKAYWLLLRDVPTPNQDNVTFTVHIPKSNRLDNIVWKEVLSYIRTVNKTKLSAWQSKGLSKR